MIFQKNFTFLGYMNIVISADASLRGKRFRVVQGQKITAPQFRAGKIPFLGLSLLPNQTETLATQAKPMLNILSFQPKTCFLGIK